MKMFVTIILFTLAVNIFAQVPKTMSYQGVLTDDAGVTVADGTYKLKFELHSTPNNGNIPWQETHENVPVSNGIFNVILGSINALNTEFNEPYFLAIAVNDGEPLEPFTPLTSVPYSLGVADSVVTASKLANNSVVRGINSITDNVTLSAGDNISIIPQGDSLIISSNEVQGSPWQGSRNVIFYNRGNVGIGTESPRTALEVAGMVAANSFSGDGAGLTGLPASPWQITDDNIFYANGNVSIGTENSFAPFHVNGEIRGDSLRFNSAVLRHISWPGSAFLPWLETYDFVRGSGYSLQGTTPGQNLRFSLPLQIPQGATIKNLEVQIRDNDEVEDVTVSLMSIGKTGGLGNNGEVVTTGSSPDIRTFSQTFTKNVNNTNTALYLQARWKTPAEPENIRIIRIQVDYEVNYALP